MKLTFLGTGTSTGIPIISCSCKVCSSADWKDKRLRCSVLIEWGSYKIVIDAGTDFRQQMLRENVKQLDALLITHAHADHIGGLDELRAFNFSQGKDMPVFLDKMASSMVQKMFAYMFAENKYPGAPDLVLNEVDQNTFQFADKTITPIPIMHGNLPITGFRIGNFTYITDANFISEESKVKIRGTKTLVINAVRVSKHQTHFNLEEALTLIDEMKVDKAYLIHISHRFGKHKEIEAMLPPHVQVAYDGLVLEVD